LYEATRRRAEEIYVRNGRVPGRDIENWVQAEMEILKETSNRSSRKTGVVVKVNGVQYVGEYDAETSDGYTPGEFGADDSVPVRFEGDKMFLKRSNGKELETTVVKNVG
jgi:Protein of unknown function (DUF2934)